MFKELLHFLVSMEHPWKFVLARYLHVAPNNQLYLCNKMIIAMKHKEASGVVVPVSLLLITSKENTSDGLYSFANPNRAECHNSTIDYYTNDCKT